MVNKYSIYYSYKTIGDVLLIVINDQDVDKIDCFDNLVVLRSKNEVVGYNIFNFSKIIKIHSHGRIFQPPMLMIDIVNNILKKYDLPLLGYETGSKFVIGKITSLNTIDCKGEILNVNTNNANIGDVVVVAYPNSELGNGRRVKDYTLCTYKDLLINNEEEIIKFEDDKLIGNDFFSWEGSKDD